MMGSKVPLFASHHRSRLSCAKTGNADEPGTFSLVIFPQRNQEEWLSKGSAVVHGGQGNVPTGRPASAASSPGRP